MQPEDLRQREKPFNLKNRWMCQHPYIPLHSKVYCLYIVFKIPLHKNTEPHRSAFLVKVLFSKITCWHDFR